MAFPSSVVAIFDCCFVIVIVDVFTRKDVMVTMLPNPLRSWRVLFPVLLLLGTSLLTACGGTTSTPSASTNVTITLEGPNQWNDSGTSFGPAWDTAVSTFEKLNPGVKVKITVLPLTNFYQQEATQLTAGTAPNLIFNQTSYKPYQVVALDSYLNQPNPYAPERPHWLDWFNANAFSAKTNADVNGHLDWVPFNLVDAGLFINQDAFAKAGVQAPITTWSDWQTAVQKLKAAGYIPLAMDNSNLGVDWTSGTLFNMMLAKDFDQLNVFDVSGKSGTATALTAKDLLRAIKLGKITAQMPEISESLQLLKETFSSATPNWSGVKGLSGAGVGLPDFIAGRAAMAWGVNFGASEVAKATFKVGSMPFPTVTSATTPLSINYPAQFGVAAGGTSYMIPSNTKGDQLKYSVRFLQFMTAPKYAQPWITTTTGVPSTDNVTAPDSIVGFSSGDWGKTPRQSGLSLTGLSPQSLQDYVQIVEGYLLGTSSLSATETKLEASWQQAVTYNIQQNPSWQSESWTK